MRGHWSDQEVERFLDNYAARWGDDVAVRTYTSRLLGAEPSLVLHGGGNTSVKSTRTTILGDRVPAIFVKASGHDLATIEPEGHIALDLAYLRRLRALSELSDEAMLNEFRTHLFDHRSPTPSLETLVHALIPKRFIDHTHADAILALTNQVGGRDLIRDALGGDLLVLDYVTPGLTLAHATADALDARPDSRGMVWMFHGIVTWGDTARESYEAMIELVTRAEEHLTKKAVRRLQVSVRTSTSEASARLIRAAPIVRGLLTRRTPRRRPVIVQPLITEEVLELVGSAEGPQLALTPPLTTDHLIRVGAFPMWIAEPDYSDTGRLREAIANAVRNYSKEYENYRARHRERGAATTIPPDVLPQVILMPGLGALCVGKDAEASTIARDITAHTLAVKTQVAALGTYQGLREHELYEMECRPFQQAKLGESDAQPLAGHVGLVTGAAGAIGSAICEALLRKGCHVAATDLPGEHLDSLVEELKGSFGSHAIGVPLDVTASRSVSEAFTTVIRSWGGLDLVVINAALAHVAPLADLDLEAFRRLEQVNVEGTLLVLAESARHFACQASGGDIVVVSTKNVFAPGAGFGAYSATKAASHQLARIASLELAELDVRVNMVAPDAVFSHRTRRSGLWAAVGPDRMRARGLDETGLEEYYRGRSLLKVRVAAEDVANAVLFFATRQTPTTGATIPVDGGLPDATPR